MLICKNGFNMTHNGILLRIGLRTFIAFCWAITASFSAENTVNHKDFATNVTPTSVSDEKLVQVGSEIITKADYQAYLRYRQLELQKTAYLNSTQHYEQFQRKVLDEIVEHTMIFLLASRENITYSQEEVEHIYEEGIQLLGGKEAYQRWLQSYHLSDEYIKQQIIKKIMVDTYIENIKKTVSISEKDVEEAYQKYKKMGIIKRNVDTYDFANILIVDFVGDPEKEKLINEIYRRTQKGEDFFALAKEYSQDTFSSHQNYMYYEMTLNDVQPEIKHYLVFLPEGAISPPFHSRNGWNIIKIVSKNSPGDVPLAKVEKGIQRDLVQQKVREVLKQELEKLKNEITITYFYN